MKTDRVKQLLQDAHAANQAMGTQKLNLNFIEASQKKRGNFKWIFIGLGIATFIRFLYLRVLCLFSGSETTKKREEAFARQYFKSYFMYRGALFYRTSPFPKTLEKPLLILACKNHAMQSLFMYQLFDFPVLIPVEKSVYSFQIFPKIPLKFIGKYLKRSSYEEVSLNNNWGEMKKMLQKGYSMILYVNPDVFLSHLHGPLYMFEELQQVLADADKPDFPADLHFLNCTGFEKYAWASAQSPMQLRCDLRPKADVYGWLSDPHSVQEKLAKITLFFESPELQFVSKS